MSRATSPVAGLHSIAKLWRSVPWRSEAKLDGVDLTGGELVISPVQASTPPEADKLKEAAYTLLPATKITDVLLEVDIWTNFTSCFTHQRNGRPADNKPALLSAVLADGINLGLNRLADAVRGTTYRQLALVHDWHIREDSYRAALARLIDVHRALPLAAVGGEGRTSSSDGQYFRAGDTVAAIADVNARHGNEPGVSFYTHVSDQFGPFYTKVIAATASEARRVFPPVRNGEDRAGNGIVERGATAVERHETALETQIAGLREVAELLRRQLDDVRADRDAWREQAQAGQRLLSFDKGSGPPDRKPWWRRIVG
jgi:hypothetical protein